MSLDTILTIGKALRESDNWIKHFSRAKSCPKGENVFYLTLPVNENYSIEWRKSRKTPQKEINQLYYLDFKTSESDSSGKFLYGDIYHKRESKISKNGSVQTKESGNYKLNKPKKTSFEQGALDFVDIIEDLKKKAESFFQKRLEGIEVGEYSNHAYLSAFAFFCCSLSRENKKALNTFFRRQHPFEDNDIIAMAVLIAKHHGDLPDFVPKGYNSSLLGKKEVCDLFRFLDNNELPIVKLINRFHPVQNFQETLCHPKARGLFQQRFGFRVKENHSPLDFFLDYQFAFSALLLADKTDAANFQDFIAQQKENCYNFSQTYSEKLRNYLSSLSQESELNRLRTKIRRYAVAALRRKLTSEERVFDLTAPTGSGKTLMMLSLASEIIEQKEAKRIIYALPFLSITEQVEGEVLKIFKGNEEYIQRIDSKSENKEFNERQQEWERAPSKEILEKINLIDFRGNTFAYPFIITTFVRFFETLLSNSNTELLKLPNFSNSVFLLDEIQALPPRLYGFFVAYLSKFCKKFNSYAIISTATQPNFSLPKAATGCTSKERKFFPDYVVPPSLLSLDYFSNPLFDRYCVQKVFTPWDIQALKEQILKEQNSCLVILNTIGDSKELYKELSEELSQEELLLLNTHITPAHRSLKIYLAQRRLRYKRRIVVVSTQLIEAGVDIDFPVLYRDFTTVASLVQSAGRCNRNGKMPTKGKVVLFELVRDNYKRANLIYRGKDKALLEFSKNALWEKESLDEKDLLEVQKSFFNKIQEELHFAKHWCHNNENITAPDFDFIEDIHQCMYRKIGEFRLIDERTFEKEVQYFVPKNREDRRFGRLLEEKEKLSTLLQNTPINWTEVRMQKRKIAILLKQMAQQIVQIRIRPQDSRPIQRNSHSYYSLHELDTASYSFEEGVNISNKGCIL